MLEYLARGDGDISIHTLRMEGDPWEPRWRIKCVFQSTPSAWRVTEEIGSIRRQRTISIHTLRMEGDPLQRLCRGAERISIHTLRVEGDCKSAQKSRTLLFKVTDLRRNCRPDVHERTEGSLWQAVFAG